MSKENKLEPSRWSPPADLVQAYNEGKATKQLPDGSTASLSWTPEMNNRWWSYDGAIGFNTGLQIIDDPKHGPQLAPYSSRGGNGIMFVPGPQIEDELAKITETDPLGQPWSYYPHDTSILRLPTSLHTMISWNDPFPAILVSHDGRIVLDEYYSSGTLGGYVIGEAVETDEQRKFYINHLFDLLCSYLRNSPRYAWRQPDAVSGWPSGELGSDDEIKKRAHAMWRLIDAKRGELVKKPRCARLRNLREWMLSLPSWASMIIGARLADAGDLSLLTGSCAGRLTVEWNNAHDIYSPMNDACCEANVANRSYSLSLLSSEQIHDDYEKCLSFEQIALEYGPCWLMQSLIALDRSPYDNPTALDLVKDSDYWKVNADRDRILASCKLAGAMNAPIELWPRFYSILENRDPSRLDETAVLMMLATPIKSWAALEEAESMASDHGKLIREVCCLVTAGLIRWERSDQASDVERKIMKSLSPDRPIAGQLVDLAMMLDESFDSIDDHGTPDPIIDAIMTLIKSKLDMSGTINGASLVARDLNRLNIDES